MLNGSIVALITPFQKNGTLDLDAIKKLAKWHLDSGTNGIVVAGCTGESFTLSESERIDLFIAVREAIGTKIPAIIGTGSSSTMQAIAQTKEAKSVGADAVLAITPYGNKPSQTALIKYFSEIADVGIPTILYNVPGRTGTTLAPETAIELSKHPYISAIKEASANLDAVSQIIRDCDLTVLSGDDSLTVPMISIGAKGVISTAANLIPKDFSEMVHYALNGDFVQASKKHLALFPIMKTLFIEGNPVPLKEAMAHVGLIGEPIFRPPLTGMSQSNRDKLISALKMCGVAK